MINTSIKNTRGQNTRRQNSTGANYHIIKRVAFVVEKASQFKFE